MRKKAFLGALVCVALSGFQVIGAPARAAVSGEGDLAWLTAIAGIALLMLFAGLFAVMVHITGRPGSAEFHSTLSPRDTLICAAAYFVAGAFLFLIAAVSISTGFSVAEAEGRFYPITGIMGFLLIYLAAGSFILGYETLQGRPSVLLHRSGAIIALVTMGLVLLMAEEGVAAKFIGMHRLLYILLPLSIALTVLHSYALEKKTADSRATLPPTQGPEEYTAKSAYLPLELQEKYTELSCVGKGGIALVFQGRRKSDGTMVAIKVPRSFDEATGRSFMREMRVWEGLSHANIVKVFTVNILPAPYVEMEYCPASLAGCNLPIPVKRAVVIARGIAEGLAFAHERGLVHRDIKPQNILFDEDGVPKITDWGLSKVLSDAGESSISGFSLAYAAPEQIAPSTYGPSDGRTDLYQLGVVLYEMVTGRHPFPGTGIAEFSEAILHHDPPLPSTISPEAAALDTVIMRCLQKRPDLRFPSALEMAAALDAASADL
ncbi:MAG: serine/threonine-protein kinase [Methanomicrobiaceae archaeon]|nr:serine/threonine-protein kinase [Methanomicrobiaceae archaeon]